MRWLRGSVVVAFLLTFAMPVQAATTSRLEGRVQDNHDRPLAGAQITISSDSLIGGSQSAITGADGGFVFHFLLVGEYEVVAELVGYQPAAATARVQLDRTASMVLRLVPLTFGTEIEVTADVPIIDPTRTNTGEIFGEKYLKLTSIGSDARNYLSIMDQAAGVVPGYPQEVFGATESENAYLVDGFNTVDPGTGIGGTRFNFDAVEEASVLTGGLSAEFGFGTGGVLNVVTKSGGNLFSGTFDARYSDERFIESGEHFDPGDDIFSNRLVSATLGGPILRDRLWFFAAVENQQIENTPNGAPATETLNGTSFLGKLTWAINPANRLTLRYATTPTTTDYYGVAWNTAPEATWRLDSSEPTGQLELNSMLSNRLLLTASLGFSRRQRTHQPMINDVDTPPEWDRDLDVYWSNPEFMEPISDRNRDHHRAKLSYFAGDALGPHQLDAGLEYHRLWHNNAFFTPGGYKLGYFNNEPWGNFWPDGDGDGLVDWVLLRDAPPETAREPTQGEGDGWSAFIQDQWRPTPQVTVNLGLRYDTLAHTNTVGEEVADFDKWLPRLGVAWDVGGRGLHVLRASWGRYMHPGVTNLSYIASGIIDGADVYYGLDFLCGAYDICDRDTAAAEFGPEFVHVGADGDEHPFYLLRCYGCVPTETVDTLRVGRLRVPYRDELILAYETRLAHETSLELSYVRKESLDLIDDTCNNNNWAWGDGEPPSINDPSTWTNEDDCLGYVLANMNGPRRDWEAIILRAASRARPWFHLLGSYTYSRQLATTDSQPYSGFESSGFEYFPTHFINQDGDLDSIAHRLKLNGYLLLPLDFALGIGASYYSGDNFVGVSTSCFDMFNPTASGLAELERIGIDYDEMLQYCQSENSGTILLDTQAGPRVDRWQLDLQLSKGFQVGTARIVGIVSVFNVTSEEATTSFTSDPFGPRGFGTPDQWQNPRRWELGFRVEF